MRRFAPILILCLFASCERGKVFEVVACAVKDDQLSVAFEDPRTAVNGLGRLVDGLEARDEETINKTIGLLESLITCIE